MFDPESNRSSKRHWNALPVGSQRSQSEPGTLDYFEDIRTYRYGYETPFLPGWISSLLPQGKRVLEIGVGNGVDGVQLASHGANYVGLDITERHLELTKRYFELGGLKPESLIEGDLLQQQMNGSFDLIYSFGVLHHIEHEEEYLHCLRGFLAPGGHLAVGLYANMSFFNAYLLVTWVLKNRMRIPLNAWRSHLSELSPLEQPLVIKIRSRREIQAMLERTGFRVLDYKKRGFVQGYLPGLGRHLEPDGSALSVLGSLFGWYHLFVCESSSSE